jgi:hypothetical protein
MLTESKTSHMTNNGSGLKCGAVGDLSELQKREYILKNANPALEFRAGFVRAKVFDGQKLINFRESDGR